MPEASSLLDEQALVVGAGQQASRVMLIVSTWMTAATVAMADVLVAQTRADLRAALFDYIEAFYNTHRIHLRLNHQRRTELENHAVA